VVISTMSGLAWEHECAGRCNCSLRGPSMPDSCRYCWPTYANDLCPLIDGMTDAIDRDDSPFSTGAPILYLLLVCRPAAVLRGVMAVVVAAINGVSARWTWPDVGEEGFKGVTPTAAYRNAPTAIQRITNRLWVFAALDHAAPDFVFGGFGSAVRSIHLAGEFTSQAATRTRPVVDQRKWGDKNDLAAVTPALAVQPCQLHEP
jgi:hypothetical protein